MVINKLKNMLFGADDKNSLKNLTEQEKGELLDSLNQGKDFDLHTVDIKHFIDHKVSSASGDYMDFKDGIVQEDSIGKYVLINGMKCREWQPGITGFVYQDAHDRYHSDDWIHVGFCDNGNRLKSVTLGREGCPKTLPFMKPVSSLLKGKFYGVSTDAEDYFLKKANSEGRDLSEKERLFSYISNSDIGTEKIGKYKTSFVYDKDIIDDTGEHSISLKGVKFNPFEIGVNGMAYLPITYVGEDFLFLAEYNNGEMDGEGLLIPLRGTSLKTNLVVKNYK